MKTIRINSALLGYALERLKAFGLKNLALYKIESKSTLNHLTKQIMKNLISRELPDCLKELWLRSLSFFRMWLETVFTGKASKGRFAIFQLFSLLILMSFLGEVNGQITPVAWYNFHDAILGRDVTGHGFDLNMNLNNLNIGYHQPVQDSFFISPNVTPLNQPFCSVNLNDTIAFDELSMAFWFRSNKDFSGGEYLKWVNKAYFYVLDDGLVFTVRLDGGGQVQHRVRFFGTGPNDMHGFFDGNWHHIVGTYDTKTGTMRIYVDGFCPPGYTLHSGTQGRLDEGGDFYPVTNIPSNISSADLDEIAIYDTVLPAALIYQHYQDGLLGLPYAQTASLNLPPFPTNVAYGGFDSLDFAPSYPRPVNAAIQLANYPLARYRPGHNMQRMIPWIAKTMDIGIDTAHPIAANVNTYGQNMNDYVLRLAQEYNFYLCMGDAKDYVGLNINTQNARASYWLSQLGRNPAYNNLPKFAFVSYGQVNTRPYYPWLFPTVTGTAGASSYRYRDFPAHCYLRTSSGALYSPRTWTWEAMGSVSGSRRDTLAYDGLTLREHLKAMNVATQGNSRLALIGENGEMLFRLSAGLVNNDAGMIADRASTGLNVGDYQALRARQLRELVSAKYRGYQDSLNQSLGTSAAALYWYNVGGKVETSHFEYPYAAPINKFEDSVARATPYFYPQRPSRWRYGVTNLTGIREVVEGRRVELLHSGQRFFPAVSPGYSDNVAAVLDRDMLRPGQFLGLMKYLAMLGADSYALFMYDGNDDIYTPGFHKAWHPATLAYAQGINSRIMPFFEDGYVLEGDLAYIFGQTISHAFNTGNPLDLVSGRRMNNSAKYVLSGSIMKLDNYLGHGLKSKDVCFQLSDSTGVLFDTMQINIRAQGSTYVLDLSGQDTVFYQLDAWHEWSEPGHWCRDFAFEAEVVDTVLSGPMVIATERQGLHAAGDFRKFTSWLDMRGNSSGVYHFATRQLDQDSLRVWIRARANALAGAAVNIRLDGSIVGQMTVQPGVWQWYGLDPLQQEIWLQNLGIAEHEIRFEPNGQGIELDKILLARNPADFTQQSFSPQAIAVATTICNGDALEVNAVGNLPGGCLMYRWDFGDDVEAFTPSASHVYSYPGSYEVVLTVTHPCLDTVAYDTIQVIVSAPMVEAGNDTFVCKGGSVQLAAEANYFFKWREDNFLSSPIVLDPIASLPESGYLHLDAWDPQTGCHGEDSVYVTLVENRDIRDTVISYCDTINSTGSFPIITNFQLSIHGGYYIWWKPDPRLSADTIRNPIATVPYGTGPVDFTVYQADFCRCDTDTVNVRLVLGGPNPQFYGDPDTLCEGDTSRLLITGLENPRWIPVPQNTWLSSNSSSSPLAVPGAQGSSAFAPQSVIFNVRGTGCNGMTVNFEDSITVIPQPFLAANTWQDTIWVCPNSQITGLSIHQDRPPASSVVWSPGWIFDDSTILNPQVVAVLNAPTEVSLSLNSLLGCPKVYHGVLMPVGILPDTLYQCPYDSNSILLGNGVTLVEWKPHGYFSDFVSPRGTFSVPQDTFVSVSYNFRNCIKIADTVHIVIHGLPQISVDTLRACAGDTLALNTTGANPVVWGPIGTMVGDSTSDSTYTVFAGQPFTLYVASCDSFFCPGFDSVVVTWLDAIQEADTVHICPGDSVDLHALAGGIGCSWSPNIQISSVSNCNVTVWPTQERYYYLDWVDASGCQAHDSVWINIDSVAFTGQLLSMDDSICVGDSIQLLATGGSVFAWSPLLDSIANPWASPMDDTTYVVTISNGHQCYIQDSVRIFVDQSFPIPNLIVTSDTICSGEGVGLIASGGTDYIWSGPSITGLTGPSINVNPDSTTVYSVSVGDGGTCRADDSVLVFMDNCCFVPNMDYVSHNGKASDLIAALGCPFAACRDVKIHIIDTLLVDVQSLTLDSSLVMMDSMAVIWVPQGHQLTLSNSTVEAACGYMWDCICIDSASANAKVQNSFIRDGVWGLRSIKGGQYAVEESQFKHNWIGITVDPYPAHHQGQVLGTRFTAQTLEMLPPHANEVAEAGIYIQGVDSIRVGVDDWAYKNTFDSLGVGIIAERSNVWVTNGLFSEGILKPNVKGMPGFGHYGSGIAAFGYYGVLQPFDTYWMHVGGDSARSCKFVDILHGIKVADNNHLDAGYNTFRRTEIYGGVRMEYNYYNTLNVHHNHFVDCEAGVRSTLNTGSKVGITENRIEADASMSALGVWLSDLNVFGTHTPNGGRYLVNENEIRLSGFGITGIAVGDLEVARNIVKLDGVYGTQARGAAVALSSCDKAKVRENNLRSFATLNDSVDGIYASLSSRMVITCNLMRDFQSGLHTYGSCDLSFVRLNEFRSGRKGIYLQNNGIIGQQGDIGVPSGNKWTGNWNCGPVEKMAFTFNTSPNLTQRVYVKNTPNMNPNHPANPGCNGFQVGAPIPFSATNGQVVNNCPNYPTNGNGGGSSSSMMAIANGISNYAVLPVESKYLDEQILLDTLNANMPLCQSNSAYMTCHQVLLASNMGDLAVAQKELTTLAPSAALIHSDPIVPINAIEANHKAVNRLLEKLMRNREQFDAVDSMALEAIAVQCPLSGGRAVYMARAAFGLLDAGRIFDEGLCLGTEKQADTPENVSLEGIKLIPNPAMHKVSLHTSTECTVWVYDLHGHLMQVLDLDAGQLELDLSNWARGIYLFRYQMKTGETGSKRLVVQ